MNRIIKSHPLINEILKIPSISKDITRLAIKEINTLIYSGELPSHHNSLVSAFSWKNTSLGYKFWHDIHYKIEKNKS